MTVSVPKFYIDTDKVIRNIENMRAKLEGTNIEFRPHFKTHASGYIGNIYKQLGIDKITVSSVEMANYFYRNNFNDITIAIPANINQVNEINELAKKCELTILLDAAEQANVFVNKIDTNLNFYIEIDNGYNRTGLNYIQVPEIQHLINCTQKNKFLHFKGLLSHFGNTYQANSIIQIQNIYNKGVSDLKELASQLVSTYHEIPVSVGDTPSCSVISDFGPISEIRPGNFVFYDLTQYHLGTCSLQDITAWLLCPVIGIYHQRNEFVIHGGAIHMSKDWVFDKNLGLPVFGMPAFFHENIITPLENSYVKSISQEHGIIKTTSNLIKKIKLGQTIAIIPAHSCLTANISKYYISKNLTEIQKFNG